MTGRYPGPARRGSSSAWTAAALLLLAGGVVLPVAWAAWEAPEGTPYEAPSREVLATPSARTGLQFHDGVLAWIDGPWNGTGPAARLAYLDTRTGQSGNVRADGQDALVDTLHAGWPSVSATHIAWVRYAEPAVGQPANPYQPGGSIHALAIGGQPVRLDAADGSIVTAPHLDGARVAWGSSRPWSDPSPTVHLVDLAAGTRLAARFPLAGNAEAWPFAGGALVLRTTGNSDDPGGLYLWDLATPPVLLTPEPARGMQLAIEGTHALWTQYREGSGRGTSIYAFDLLALRESRLTLSPGRESSASASGSLVAWSDLRSEPDCPRGGCAPRYNLYFADRATGNEYKLEGTWGFSAGPALDGHELAYGDAGGRLRIATLPGPGDLLVATANAVVAEAGSSQLGVTPPGQPSPPLGAHVLQVRLDAPGNATQRWDRDLDGVFETDGALQVVLENNTSPVQEAFGYVVDEAGRVAAMGVDVQELLAEALATPTDDGNAAGDAADPDGPDGNAAWATRDAGGIGAGVGVLPAESAGTGDGVQDVAPDLDTRSEAVAPDGDWPVPPAAAAAVAVAGLGAAGSVAAALARPAWLRRLAPLGLFSRLRASEVLDHPVRRHLADLVTANPGIHYQELVRRVGRGRGVVEHHLASLVASGVVVRVQQGRYVCHFHRDARGPLANRTAFGALKAEGARGVLAALGRQQRQGQELATELGLSPTTVSYHLRRLAEAGLVERRGPGARVIYTVTPAGRRALADGLAG